jgi:hypothetical protein
MPVTYQNWKGDVYYLHQGITKTGNPRYWFSRDAAEPLVEQVPAGYTIAENVNGFVSLRRLSPALIADNEVQMVRRALDRTPRLRDYKVEVKKNILLIYQPIDPLGGGILEELLGVVALSPERAEKLHDLRRRSIHYNPVLRLTLVDRQKRIFTADRMFYSGEGGWLPLAEEGRLDELTKRYLKHLGRDSFFEMF